MLARMYDPAVATGLIPVDLWEIFYYSIGFVLQQTAANPFVVAMGSPETARIAKFCRRINNIGG